MLDTGTLKQLKQVNITKDALKTKERVRDVWSPLKKPQREEILTLAGINKVTVERSYKNGNISAKLAAAMAQVLKIDPNYLTGLTDDPQEYSDALVVQFLTELGYKNINSTTASTRKPRRTKKQMEAAAAEEAEEADETEEPCHEEKEQGICRGTKPSDALTHLTGEVLKTMDKASRAKLDALTDEELNLLLKGQIVQSAFDSKKQSRLALIKYLLVQ